MTAPDLQAVAARDGLTNSTEGYSSTFYPSATSRLAAVPVVVRGGIESLATDITMQKPKTYAVTGRILLRAAIPPRAPTTRGLVPTTTGRYFIFPRGDEVLETGQNHRPFPLVEEFQIPGLLPGSYDLVLRVGDF